ncbi:MAG TPA: recombinase family protein [Ktedonobacteraceae bacterium]|nr:recombinase family protein [Ktedonobacteraceae bacterium]
MRKLTVYTPPEFILAPIIDKSRDTAIYVRQSDEKAAEKNPFSRASQLKLVEFAMQLRGETNTDHIRIYDEKDGVSGQIPIEKRPKIKQLYADIAAGEIGSVIVIAPDRLFRDKYGIQSGTFIEIADMNGVTVFVPLKPSGYTKYDCTIYEDREALDRKFKEARAYLETQIYGKLNGAQDEKAKMGLYYGQMLAPGYVVLKDAPKMEQKLLIYEAWAEKVRWMSRRFKETDLTTLCREIEAMPYLYKDPAPEELQRYLFRIKMRHVEGGYKPARDEVVKYTLINPFYLGHTIWKNQIVAFNSHPAILDEDEFTSNLYRLTGRDLYGNPVEGYNIRLRESSPYQTVLKYVITSPHGAVYAKCEDEYGRYLVKERVAKAPRMRVETLFAISADQLDQIFLDRLKAVAQADKHLAKHIQGAIKDLMEQHKTSNASIEKQLIQCRNKIANLQKTIKDLEGILPLEDKIQFAKDLAGLRAEEKKILASQTKADDADLQKDFDELSDVLGDVAGTIDGCSVQRLQKLARLTTTKVELEELSIHWLRLTICWRGPLANREDVCMIWRNHARRQDKFTPDEDEILQRMFKTSPIVEICKALPNRTHGAFRERAKELGLVRTVKRGFGEIPRNVCWQDIEVMPEVALDLIRQAEEKELSPFWLYSASVEELAIEIAKVANANGEDKG